jgi:two-component system response regulator HydG
LPGMGWQAAAAGSEAHRDVPVLVVQSGKELLSVARSTLAQAYRSVTSVSDPERGVAELDGKPFVVAVVDVSDPEVRGVAFLRRVLAERRAVMVVAVADAADNEGALRAARLGAFQCLRRPFFHMDLREAVDAATEDGLRQEASVFSRRCLSQAGPGKRLIGSGRAMRDVVGRIDMVRQVNCNVIVRGETGTGKELVARAIHENSARAAQPFVKLNCGAIPRDLLESELFGHERGAFTGAMQRRVGRFEMAHRGTILLDEIGDMPLQLQVKLLSVIQDRAVQRVGGADRIPVDVRIIAATHQDLERAIEEGRFRDDLYYRLNVVTIRVPTLRERREDIPLLARHFLKVYRHATGRPVRHIDPAAMQLLREYDYPGNVRELENFVQSAVVFCQGHTIRAENLPRPIRAAAGPPAREFRVAAGTPLEEVERLCIIETLRHTEGNKRRAAALLGISEKSIYNKLERYNISLASLKLVNGASHRLSSRSEHVEHA